MDKNAFELFVQYLKHQRLVVDYVHIAGFTLLVWDYCLTLPQEIKTIWRSKPSYTKVLFLITRYLPLVNIYFILHNQLLLDVTKDSCGWTFPMASWIIVVGVFCAEVILAVRTWAVWHQDFRIFLGLSFLQIAILVVNCYSTNNYLKSMQIAAPLYPGYRGCFVVSASGDLWMNFFALMISQSVVLTLMVVRAFAAYRSGHMNELTNVIHRDGIFFYVVLLAIAITNLVVILVLPPDFENLFTPLQSIFHSVFTTRIIMNIRTVGNRDMSPTMPTELHSNFYESQGVSMSLVFSPALHHPDMSVDKVEESPSSGLP